MNGLDIAILVSIAFTTLLSLYWGVTRQVLAIAGLVVGILAASAYHQQAATVISSLLPANTDTAELLGFGLVMGAVSVLVSLLASLLRLFVGLLFLGWLDHLLGAVLGFVQGVLFIAVLLAVGTALPEAGLQRLVVSSQLAPLFRLPVQLVLYLLPERFWLLNQIIFRN